MVMEVLHEDTSEGNIQCLNHPFKNSSPGGICAFCLQEKLGKLVSSSSSSFPSTVFPSSGSSSSSPSFRSDNVAIRSSENIAKNRGFNNNNNNGYHQPTRRSRLPFALPHKKNKNQKDGLVMGKMSFPASDSTSSSVVFNRSKSTSASSRTGTLFLDDAEDKTPRKRGFWSFLHSSSKHPSNRRSVDKPYKDSNFTPTTPSSSVRLSSSVCGVRVKKIEELAVVVDDENSSSPDESERKVSRSRSVGCGSRSFSNDLFEKISNGFGDCALRRVESHREGKSRTHTGARKSCVGMIGHDFIKERVRCGGIFSGFMHVSSSSPSSSSSYNSSYVSGKLLSASASASHGRSKSWGWAFASPMRAFAKTPSSSSSGKKSASDNIKNGAPNLSAIPSILAASG